MHNILLPYYQNEMSHLLQLLQEFSQKHPQVGASILDDPGVGHLLEASALLNARLRHKLDDDIPELSEPLLENLSPLFSRLIPSMSIARFHINAERLFSNRSIPKTSLILATDKDNALFQWQSCYPVELLPIEISQVSFCMQQMALSIKLRTTSKLSFADFNFDRLRFFINAPISQAHQLYELLFGHMIAMTVSSNDGCAPLALSSLNAVGFSKDETILPCDDMEALGCYWLTEFFVLPEKFLFFDILNLKEVVKSKVNNVDLMFYFNKTIDSLDKNINVDWFLLGCAPVVNLFKKRVKSDHSNASFGENVEVYRAEQLSINDDGVDFLCCNRILPEPVSIFLDKPQEIIKSIEFLQPLTETKYIGENNRWDIIAHKANHPCLFHDIDFFKHVLRLYHFDFSKSVLQGFLKINSVQKNFQYKNNFCFGLEITFKIDASKFIDRNLFLLMRILERFIAEYFNNNQAIQLLAFDGHRELYCGSVCAGVRGLV